MIKYLKKYRAVLFFVILEAIAFYSDFKLFVNTDATLPEVMPFVEIMFSSLVNFSAVWITCYLLIAQVFKDRYSLENADEAQLSPMSAQLVNITVSVVVGSVMMFLAKTYTLSGRFILSMIVYCLFNLYVIVSILFSAKVTVKTMMTNTVVDKKFKEIKKELKKNGKVSDRSICNLLDIFEESILKDDNYVAEHIILKSEELFKTVAEKSNNKILDLKNFSEFIFDEIEKVKDSHSSGLVNKMFEQQKNILLFLYMKDKSLFRNYLKQYCISLAELQNNGDEITEYFIEKTYSTVFKDLLLKTIEERDDEIFCFTLNKVTEFFKDVMDNRYAENSVHYAMLLKSVSEGYYSTCKHCLADKNITMGFLRLISHEKAGNDVFEVIRQTLTFTRMREPETAYTLYEKLYFKKPLKDYQKAPESTYITNKSKTLSYLMPLHDEYLNKNIERAMKLRADSISDSIISGRRSFPVFATGEFLETIKAGCQYTMDNLVSDYIGLTKKCLFEGNITAFARLIAEYGEIYKNCEQKMLLSAFYKKISTDDNLISDKDMLKAFLKAITFLVNEDDQHRDFTILLSVMVNYVSDEGAQKEIILALTSLAKSSKEMATKIIPLLSVAGTECDSEAVKKLIITMVIIIHRNFPDIDITTALFTIAESGNCTVKKDVIDRLDYIIRKSEISYMENLYRRIYNICISSIKETDENTLKYGFSILRSNMLDILHNKNEEAAEYVFGRITDIYEIATEFPFTYSTKISMLTVFVVLGMYCHQNKLKGYLDEIYRILKKAGDESVSLAIRIALDESSDCVNYIVCSTDAVAEFLKDLKKETEDK